MTRGEKSIFVCRECGHRTPKWMGRCPDCGKWHTLEQEPVRAYSRKSEADDLCLGAQNPVPLDAVNAHEHSRLATGIKELDRVLGGGLVSGSMVLIGGDPGIGKSTLMLQTLHSLSEKGCTTLYVSGEESVHQIKLRSSRVGSPSPGLWVVSETSLERIRSLVQEVQPKALVLDSVQTTFSQEIESAPGSVSQVREVTLRLVAMAKQTGIPTFLVGHVTKEGAIAGPRLLEHMVDTVLYFEGDRNHVFRILRAVKNRFGSTNEIGVFEMKERGLAEVENPSAVFLSERPSRASGSVVTACMEGSRPILVELQALASPTNFGTPRRTVLGLDANRVALLLAVLEKKVGFCLVERDVFMNVVGGVKVEEPAVDLGVLCAVASSFLDRPIHERTVVFGEVGLAGEIRSVSHLETRVREAGKMGFDRCIAPMNNLQRLTLTPSGGLVGVRTVTEAMELLF